MTNSNPNLYKIELKFWKIIMPAVNVLAGIIRKINVLLLQSVLKLSMGKSVVNLIPPWSVDREMHIVGL